MARLRSVPDLRGPVRGGDDLVLPQAGAHLLHQPPPGSPADQLGPDGGRHCQVSCPLHFGAIRFRLRHESTALVSTFM